MPNFPLCSDCFRDEGLRLDSEQIGISEKSRCPNCGSSDGKKLNIERLTMLAHRFFVWGTLHRCNYGAAPLVVFNQHQATNISTSPWFEPDIRLIEQTLGVGFFYYGPRLWMVGEVEPLKALQDPTSRTSITSRIVQQYPTKVLSATESFYRIRKDPKIPHDLEQYDSRPLGLFGAGRLDSPNFPVMYASQDLHVCVHECRVTAEDELYVATLSPTHDLKLLDLSVLLEEAEVAEFESLDMAVHMLFLAGKHAYEITRDVAVAVASAGYDGLVYPSYFSLLRTGGRPFETAYGLSHRRLPHLREYEKEKTVANLALFGRPIKDGSVAVRCINKVVINRVDYRFHFGPVGCDPEPSNSS
ncbi:MAG: RES domain-containing protein [Verrucomicrobia bacterium]|nr:MAG: RES domain-containing protein [Verrucomicrobiota bacterium]